MNPLILRVNGRGGDGGRDAIFNTPKGPEIYQMKYFPDGKMSDHNRWEQVRSSFSAALRHNPTSWALVVPLDPTPRDLEKFAEMTAVTDAPCSWHGLSWLEARLAEYPAVQTVLQTPDDKLHELAKLYNQEVAILAGGVLDMAARLQNLADLFEQQNPFYRVGVSVNGRDEPVHITLAPKYLGSFRDHPPQLQVILEDILDDEARGIINMVPDNIKFGRGVDMPETMIHSAQLDISTGSPTYLGRGSLHIPENRINNPENFSRVVRALAPSGEVLASLPLTATGATVGVGGVATTLQDDSGLLQALHEIDLTENTATLSLHMEIQPGLPSDLLLPLRLMVAAHAPNTLAVFDLAGVSTGIPEPLSNPVNTDLLALVEILQTLALLQDRAQCWFDVDRELTFEEVEDIRLAGRLLSGETVAEQWETQTLTLRAEAARVLVEHDLSAPPEGVIIVGVRLFEIVVCGNTMVLGRSLVRVHAAHISNREGVFTALASSIEPPELIKVELTPGVSDTIDLQLEL